MPLPVPILLALAALLAAPQAAAERADREKEMVINADVSQGDDANKVVTLSGNVVVTQGTMKITAAKMTLKEDAKGNKSFVATGAPVTFRQKKDKVDEWVDATAERAEFDDRTEILRLYNNARVKSGGNEITSEFISYDMARELAEASGAPPGKAVAANSRVKVVIVPKKKPAEGEEGRKAPALELKSDPGKS